MITRKLYEDSDKNTCDVFMNDFYLGTATQSVEWQHDEEHNRVIQVAGQWRVDNFPIAEHFETIEEAEAAIVRIWQTYFNAVKALNVAENLRQYLESKVEVAA